MIRKISLGLSTLLATSTIAFSVGEANAATDSYSFSACLQEKQQANVILLMDESGSMYEGGTDGKGSDPKNLRIAGAEILIDRLQAVVDKYQGTVNVQLAGFGDNYVVRSAPEWAPLSAKNDSAQDKLRQMTHVWADRSQLHNSRETDLVSGLTGVTQSMASVPAESCKLFVFFKDGEDFQSFAPKGKPSEVVGYDKINKLLKAHKTEAANNEAVRELCRPGGLGDQLRQDSNLYTIGIGVDGEDSTLQEGFQKFQSLINGDRSKACGTGGDLPPHGRYVKIQNVEQLPALFFTMLDSQAPNKKPTPGKFTLNMKHALTSFTVLTGGATDNYTVTLPKSCTGVSPVSFKSAQSATTEQAVGQGVSYQAKWVGDPNQLETLKIVFKHTDLNDDSCWVGPWTIDPGNQAAQSTLSFDADLQAIARFANSDPFVVPGKDGLQYNLELQHPSDSALQAIPAESLDQDLTFTATGILQDSTTKQAVASIEPIVLTKADLDTPQTLLVPADVSFGAYELVIKLDVQVAGFEYPLDPITTQQTVQVRSDIAPPTVSGISDFGILNGTDRSKAEVTFVGSPEEDFKIDLASGETSVVSKTFPEGVKYRFAFKPGEKTSLVIPKNQTVKLTVWLEAYPSDKNGDGEIHSQTDVVGDFKISASPVSREDYSLNVLAPFKAKQHASADGLLRILFIALFVLIGLALNFSVLKFVSFLVARFPNENSDEYAGNWSIAGSTYLTFDQNGFRDIVNAQRLTGDDNQLQKVEFDPQNGRKRVTVAGYPFQAQSQGLGLQDAGHGVTNAIGFSSASRSNTWIPLDLGGSWVLATTTEDIQSAQAGSTGTATFILLKKKYDSVSAEALFQDFYGVADTEIQRLMSSKKPTSDSLEGPKANFFSNLFKKKDKPAQEEIYTTSNSGDDGLF
jgi:hypothetical protein